MRHQLLAVLVVATSAVAAGCASSGPSASPSSTVTVTAPATTSTSAPSSTPTPPPSTTTTQAKPTPTPPPPVAPTLTAQQVVEAYYDAINAHDYSTAWQLAGGSTSSPNYATFVAGFADTAVDELSVTGVQGDTVSIHLDAIQTDGSDKVYQGTYTVRGGHIVGASVQQIATLPGSGATSPPSGIIRPPNGGFYSRGEFCPDADAGLTTLDAQGNTLVCVLESGRYHWH